MSNIFGKEYARAYDALYQEKNYQVECDLVEKIFSTFTAFPIQTVLDLGCGTGNHAIPLAKRGYRVVGVDRSQEMLDEAREKALAHIPPLPVEFHQADVRLLELGKRFDAALLMFAVLGYQLTNADVLASLRSTRKHLIPGGLLVFDVWYGPAVLHLRPSERMKVVPTSKGQIIRWASGELDPLIQLCRVDYHVWNLEEERLVAESQESHQMRFFFPLELALFLKNSDFQLLHLGAFPEYENAPDENTWNILCVARAADE
jgi:SAM-dependent methyltransferase